MKINLTPHFTVSEATYSEYAIENDIDNTIPAEYYSNAINLCRYVLEPIRQHFGQPVIINSLYRCKKVNDGVGGSKNSDHLYAKAADIMMKKISLIDLAEYIQNNLLFKQLILEPTWIHISFDKEDNKKEVLTNQDGKYLKGLIQEK